MGPRIARCIAIAVAGVLLAGVAAPAAAITTLVTPPVAASVNEFLFCRVLNAGPKKIDVSVAMVDADGKILNAGEGSVDAGNVGNIGLGGPNSVYCRVTGAFTKSLVRVIVERVANGVTLFALPAE